MESKVAAEEVCRHPLNDSPTKQQYTFPKSTRFTHKSTGQDLLYDLPSTLKPLSYSFGLSKRSELGKDSGKHPAPGDYDPISMRNKGKGWSFGASKQKREQTVAVKGKVPADPDIPGPGTYDVLPEDFGFKGRKYTLRPRTSSPEHRSSLNPGPGTYYPPGELTLTGFYFPSRYPSSKSPKIAPAPRRSPSPHATTPGPGSYDPRTHLSSTGEYYISAFRSSQSRSFGRARRLHSVRAGTPGPGAYRLPSDFGYYDTENARKKGSPDMKFTGRSYMSASTTPTSHAVTQSGRRHGNKDQ